MSTIIEHTVTVGGITVSEYKNKSITDYNLAFRAKNNCRHCHGRGKLHYDFPGKGAKWTTVCSCVRRKRS